MELNFGIVEGLPDEEQRQLREILHPARLLLHSHRH